MKRATAAFMVFATVGCAASESPRAQRSGDASRPNAIRITTEKDKQIARLLSVGGDPALADRTDPYDFAIRCGLGLDAFIEEVNSRALLSEPQRRALADVRASYAQEAARLGAGQGKNAAAQEARAREVAASLSGRNQLVQIAIACLRARQS